MLNVIHLREKQTVNGHNNHAVENNNIKHLFNAFPAIICLIFLSNNHDWDLCWKEIVVGEGGVPVIAKDKIEMTL